MTAAAPPPGLAEALASANGTNLMRIWPSSLIRFRQYGAASLLREMIT